MKNLSCPNRNLPEWKALVAKVGTFEAYRDYLETNGEIRDPKYVASKIRAREFERGLGFYKGDIALMEQEDEKQEEFNQELNEKLKNILQKLYPEISLQYTNQPILPGQGEVFNQQSDIDNSVNYMLKSVSILQSDKAKQVFEKGKKAKWDLNKILTELQIPKEQKQLLLDLGITDREDLLLNLLSNYSYTVEINTAKALPDSLYDYETGFEYNGIQYGEDRYTGEYWYVNEFGDNTFISEKEYKKIQDSARKNIPSQYYSNLTVPGGTNYTENEIATPAITPSIKGHAQFATDKGIGWFRSDEQKEYKGELFTLNNYFYNTDGKSYRIEHEDSEGGESKVITREEYEKARENKDVKFINQRLIKNTRRILEVQSDLFQKGRDLDDLVTKQTKSSLDRFSTQMSNLNRALDNSEITLEEYRTQRSILESNQKLGDKFKNLPDNQFLQLLNKDNNWITFFVKSIIQDSAKEGYEKVLFPSGNTASKVEGHTTLEEFKKEKELQIKRLTGQLSEAKNSLENPEDKYIESIKGYQTSRVGHGDLDAFKDIVKTDIEKIEREINQLKQELERVEGSEGFGALKPIWKFYEETVFNILKKQGYNPMLITDEYGNTWNEVTINTATDLSPIMLQKDRNRIIGQANVKAMSVLIDAVNQKQDTLPHEYAHHYIAWFRNTPIVQEAIKKWDTEEALVQAIGEQAVKQKGEAYNWWKKFVKWVLKKFENISAMDKKELAQVLTNAFLTRTDLSTLTKKPTELSKFKKSVGLTRKEVSMKSRPTILAKVRSYNKFNNTNYYVSWNQIGQSNTYTYTITGGLKPGKQTQIAFSRYDNITAPENLIPNSTVSNEVLSKLPVEYNQEVNNKELGKRMISTIGKRVAENLGIAYENVTPEQAAELTSKADIQWNGEPAFFIGDTVYFVGENTSEATQLHEFAHPLVRAILVSNPQLFYNLYNKVANSVEGQQVIAEVSKRYPEYAKESDRFKEEVIVRATEKAAVLQRQNQLASNAFIRAIQDILYQFKKLLRQLFGKVKVSDLNVNTSIDELADMLQNEFFDIKQDIVSLKDQVAYSRTTDEFRTELSEIIEKDPAGLQSIADEMYKLSSNYLYKLEKDGKYDALKEILKDQFSSNDLAEIKSSVSNYQRVVIKKARQVREDINFRRNQSAAIVQNIQRVFQIATKLNSYMAEVAKETATPDSVNKMHYYSTMLNDIKEFADRVATVLDQNDLGTSKLGDYVNAIKGRVDASQKYSSKVYAEGVSNVLYSFIEDTNKALEKRKKERIAYLESKNARPSLIEKEKLRFDELIVDKEKFIATLNGNLGDQSALSAFFESYAGNPDPVIASFGLFVKKHVYDVLYKTRERIFNLHEELVPALEKAGYKGTNPEAFFKDVVHLEKTFSVENGEEKLNQFDYAFLAPVKGADYYYAQQSFLKKKLKQKAIETGDYTEYAKFLKEEAQYKRKYFNQEHSDEYYDLDKIYDKDHDYTDEFGKKQTINGWEAYAQLETINQDLRLIEDDPMEDLDIQQKTRDKEVVLRKRARLFDLRYENGQPKVGKDLAIAEILNAYKEAAKPFVEYNPRPEAFQKYLSRYEEMLTARGITGEQFDNLREKFILANTEIAYEDVYYQDLAAAAQELDAILSTIPSYKNKDKVKGALEEISSALLGYRDENGQPIATDMSDDRIKRVKDAELLMDELKNELGGTSGLTADEWDEYRSYWDIINSKKKLTVKQQERFDLLNEQKEGGLTPLQKKLLAKAYDKFNTIRYKEATDYYIDKFNYFLSKIDTDILNNEYGVREVDKGIIEDILSGYNFETDKLFALLNQDEEFKKWFEENHYAKTYFDKKKNDEVVYYKRVGVWSVNRPANDKYYKKTTLPNGETINRVPSFKFRERKIKDKVEIKDQYGRVVKTINNKTPRIVGETVDNRNGNGRWLPKSIEQGAPQDSPFINNDYYALKNNNPDKFKAMELLKKFHLASQEGLDNQSKNYLYIPRYGKELSEKLQTKGALKEKRNKLTEFFTTLKEAFVARPDDYDKGLNYKPEDQYMAIASDIFNDEESSIAITGLSNMEYSAVSLDLPQVVMKFGLAAEKQKKLTEIWPISNALSQLLSDPKASLTIEKMVNSQYVNRQLAIRPSKKGNSQRAQSVKNLIDREFKGINLKGLGSDQPWLIKGVSNLMKTASFGFFGLDLQSATTNTAGMYFQSIIYAAGGKNINETNLAAGTYWANSTLMRQLSMSVYKKGQNKPLELQLWEVFDPAQGRLQSKMPEELSRTLGRDVMNLSFIYSPRKFGELSNIASMWGGMMMQKKIEQKVGNTTKEISYLEAWEVGPDGKPKLKDGIDKSYDIGGNEFRLFQNMVHESMRKLGTVADYDSPEANRILVFRMIAFLRRHLVPMIIHRMGFAGKPWAPKENVNYAMGDSEMGTYIRTLKELLSAFKYGGDNIRYMDKQDAAAFYRALTEVGGLIACSLALYWLFGYDPDDEDRYKKLRKKSGPLPTPWTDEDEMRRYPFNLQGWLANHAVYQLIKVRAENESFLPLPGFGLDDYSKLIEFDAGAIFSPTIGNTTKILTGLWDYSMDNPSAYYKKDVGAYDFQQSEGLKALNYLAKMVGITGKTTDPVMAIKNFTSIQAKTSGSTSGRTKKQDDRESDTYLIR